MSNSSWIDPRITPPKNGQNCFFRCTNNNNVYIGFFELARPDEYPGFIGTFYTGTIFNGTGKFFGCAKGIGFHVWTENQFEVSHYMPIILPTFDVE